MKFDVKDLDRIEHDCVRCRNQEHLYCDLILLTLSCKITYTFCRKQFFEYFTVLPGEVRYL